MTDPPSRDVFRSLAAPDAAVRETAWGQLLAQYNLMLLKVAGSLGGDHDAKMDRYAYILGQLREDNFRRLLSFRPEGPARFSTWLVVVAGRLAVDHYRSRFGRTPATTTSNGVGRDLRRRLALSESDVVDLGGLPDPSVEAPEEILDADSRSQALTRSIAGLDPRDQLLLKLRFEDELTAADIVRLMGFSSRLHVYRRIYRLLEQLKGALVANPVFRPDA